MKTVTSLTLLGALALLAGCHKAGAPPDVPKSAALAPPETTACTDCEWQNFIDKPLPVKRIECTNEGKPEHCHLTTENYEPKREVRITMDPASGAYNWQLVTPDKPNDRMDCPNLAPDANNRRVLEGTCIIYDSDHGPMVHFFRATLGPKEDDPTKGTVSGEFRHTPFGSGPSPVHDGHIHTN